MSYNILAINWQDIRNPLGGGAEVHFHEIFKRIVQRGHRVTLLCCSHQDLPAEEDIDGIKIIRSGHRNFFNFWVPFLYRKYSNANRYDVVIDDINKIPFYSPLFVKEPLIGIIHHLFGTSIFIESSLPIALYVTTAELLIPKVYRNIPMAVVSNSTKQELVQKGFSADQVDLVYNAVDHAAYRYFPDAKSVTPLVGYLGRIKRYKSVNHLIQAFDIVQREIADAKLLIIGDGDHLPKLKKLVKQLKLDQKVIFTGALQHDQKINSLNRMWVSVNPSPKEGWGLTVIEANCCGVPVIAANSPGLRDSVVDGKTGLLYPYGDEKRLADLIVNVIQNVNLRKNLSEESMAWAVQFNWERSAENMLNVIEKTLSRR